MKPKRKHFQVKQLEMLSFYEKKLKKIWNTKKFLHFPIEILKEIWYITSIKIPKVKAEYCL